MARPASRKALLPPRLPKLFERDALPRDQIRSVETYRSLRLHQADLSELRGERMTFQEAHLTHATLTGSRLESPSWADALFEQCDLSNARWNKGALIRAQITSSRLVGFSLGGEGYLESVVFTACNCHLASFRFVRFKGVRFEDCLLNEADFQGCDLSTVAFVRCDLRSAEMSQARLRGVDLRGSEIEGIRAGPAELQGAIIDPVQAAAVAQAMGIKVEWPEG